MTRIYSALKGRYDRLQDVVRNGSWVKHAWEPFAKALLENSAGSALREFLDGRDPTAIPPDYSDLWSLYRIVRRIKPAYVVEYGAGVSTVVLSEALRNNGKGYLMSIDADKRWAAKAKRTLPKDLRHWCEIVYSELESSECYGKRVLRHVVKPDRTPDMIYLDGPDFSGRDSEIAADLLDIEAQLKPGFVLVIDCRYKNTNFLRQHLKRQYRFSHAAFHQVRFELAEGYSATVGQEDLVTNRTGQKTKASAASV